MVALRKPRLSRRRLALLLIAALCSGAGCKEDDLPEGHVRVPHVDLTPPTLTVALEKSEADGSLTRIEAPVTGEVTVQLGDEQLRVAAVASDVDGGLRGVTTFVEYERIDCENLLTGWKGFPSGVTRGDFQSDGGFHSGPSSVGRILPQKRTYAMRIDYLTVNPCVNPMVSESHATPDEHTYAMLDTIEGRVSAVAQNGHGAYVESEPIRFAYRPRLRVLVFNASHGTYLKPFKEDDAFHLTDAVRIMNHTRPDMALLQEIHLRTYTSPFTGWVPVAGPYTPMYQSQAVADQTDLDYWHFVASGHTTTEGASRSYRGGDGISARFPLVETENGKIETPPIGNLDSWPMTVATVVQRGARHRVITLHWHNYTGDPVLNEVIRTKHRREAEAIRAELERFAGPAIFGGDFNEHGIGSPLIQELANLPGVVADHKAPLQYWDDVCGHESKPIATSTATVDHLFLRNAPPGGVPAYQPSTVERVCTPYSDHPVLFVRYG